MAERDCLKKSRGHAQSKNLNNERIQLHPVNVPALLLKVDYIIIFETISFYLICRESCAQ
jgi:hypothetical protein